VKDVFSSFEVFILTAFTLQATKKGEGPPAKRAKKDSDAKQSSTKGSKQKKSLSLLPTMPLDVLFEVKNVLLVLPAHAHRYSTP
jgi:hypothetical protein